MHALQRPFGANEETSVGDVPPYPPGIGLDAFATAHGVALARFAYVLCGNRSTADDLVQDTYLNLYRRFGDRLTIIAPLAYARRTLANLYLSQRRLRSSGEITLAELPETPAADAVDHGAQDEMWRMLAGLTERQRTAVVLRFYLDLPDVEIASILNCREGTVRSLASRALAELRRHPNLTRATGPQS